MSSRRHSHADDPRLSTSGTQRSYTGAMTDVGTPVHSQIAVNAIANAIAQSWQGEASTTVRMLADNAVYLHERKLVEWVFESTKVAAEYADVFKQIRKRGIDVGVVLPMPEL